MTVLPVVLGNGHLLAPDGSDAYSTFPLGSTVTLSVQNAGVFASFRWAVKREPAGSAAVLSSAVGASPTLGPLDSYNRWSVRCIGYDGSGNVLGAHVVYLYVVGPDYNLRQLADDEDIRVQSEEFRAIINEHTLAIQAILAGGGGGGVPTPSAALQALISKSNGVGGFVDERRRLTADDIAPAYTISLAYGGAPIVEMGTNVKRPLLTASYSDAAAPDVATLTDNHGTPTKDVASTPTLMQSEADVVLGTFGEQLLFTLHATKNGVSKNSAAVGPQAGAKVYWGISADSNQDIVDMDDTDFDDAIAALASSAVTVSRVRPLTFSTPGAGYTCVYVQTRAVGAPTIKDKNGFVVTPTLVRSRSTVNSKGVAVILDWYALTEPSSGVVTNLQFAVS